MKVISFFVRVYIKNIGYHKQLQRDAIGNMATLLNVCLVFKSQIYFKTRHNYIYIILFLRNEIILLFFDKYYTKCFKTSQKNLKRRPLFTLLNNFKHRLLYYSIIIVRILFIIPNKL